MTGTQMPLRTTAAWTTHPNANPQGRPSTPAVTRHATASAEKSPSAAPVESEERSFATSPAKKTTNASSETVAAARVRRGARIPRVYRLAARPSHSASVLIRCCLAHRMLAFGPGTEHCMGHAVMAEHGRRGREEWAEGGGGGARSAQEEAADVGGEGDRARREDPAADEPALL